MLAFWVFAKDFIIFARDKQTFILLILMPLILIAILGAALSGLVQDSNEDAVLANFNIAIVDEDQSEESLLLVDDIFVKQLSNFMTIHKLQTNEVNDAFSANEITMALYIPQGFGAAMDNHEATSIRLVNKGDTSIEESIISIALLHYQNVNIAIEEVVKLVTETLIAQAKETGETPDITGFSSIVAKVNETGYSLREAKTELNTRMTEQTVGSFQYYAVGMGVMYLLITVNVLVGQLLSEKENPVYLRQFVSKLTAQQYLLGKFMSLVIITFVQLLITILGTHLLFKVNWGDSIISIIFTMLTLTMSTSAVGLVIASFINKASLFNNMSMIVTQILSALGGSFVPIYIFPDWMVSISKILPNALGLQMFLDVMTGAVFADIWQAGAISLGVSAILFVIAWLRLGRRGGAVHA